MIHVSWVVLFLIVLRSASSSVRNCSQSQGPCWCGHDRIFLKLHCKNVDEGIRRWDDPITIEVDDDDAEELKSGTFKGLIISKLWLHLPRLRHVDDATFQDLRKCLVFLVLRNGKLVEFPSNAVRNLTELRTLSITGQQIRALPSLRRLSLEHLLLQNNRISTVAEDAFPIKLKSLGLNDNQLKILNGSLQLLNDVYWLFIQNNKLTNLSGELTNMKALEILNAQNNNIEVIDDAFKNLKVLTNLNLAHNRIKKVRNNLHGLITLVKLNLSYNLIRNLYGKEFVDLINLEILNLSHNRLESVGDAFSHTRKLSRLFLAGNNLHFLDISFGCLRQLHVLDVSNNFLTELDWLVESDDQTYNCSRRSYSSLKWLILTENPLQCHSFRKINATLKLHRIRVRGSPSC